MKLISMLLALLIIGYLILQQIYNPAATDAGEQTSYDSLEPPKVPTRPQDVQKFDQDINQFVNDSKDRMDQQLEQAE